MLGILNIGRRKLEMTTSNSFGKGRTLLTMKFWYGRRVDTGFLGNWFTKKASIKQEEDDALLGKKKRSDHTGGWEWSVWTFLNSDILLICISLFVLTNNGNYSIVWLRSMSSVEKWKNPFHGIIVLVWPYLSSMWPKSHDPGGGLVARSMFYL